MPEPLTISRNARERMRQRDVTVAELDAVLLQSGREPPDPAPPAADRERAPPPVRVGCRVSRVLGGRRVVVVTGPSRQGGVSVWTVWRAVPPGKSP
jgi:hypothetical protein